nr:MAG TPA: hypothetical protein [Crassvirales sp.]
MSNSLSYKRNNSLSSVIVMFVGRIKEIKRSNRRNSFLNSSFSLIFYLFIFNINSIFYCYSISQL